MSWWNAEEGQCCVAGHPAASSCFWQECCGRSLLPVWTGLWWSTAGTIWSCQIFLDAFQQGFYVLWSSVDVSSTCLYGLFWRCQQARQPRRASLPQTEASGGLGFFSLERLQGLLQHLFTLKIIFNGEYQVVVCHHFSLPGSSEKRSLPWSGETTSAASNTNTT